MYRVAVITLSDKGARGEREDVSGQIIEDMVKEAGYEVVSRQLLSDDRQGLTDALISLCDSNAAELILTTGGTGFSPRDNAPEATLAACERMAPGIAEAMRIASLQITPRAMLSRAVSGIRKKTLIVNLPGSPKAVRECLGAVLPALGHGIEILRGVAGECGSHPDRMRSAVSCLRAGGQAHDLQQRFHKSPSLRQFSTEFTKL